MADRFAEFLTQLADPRLYVRVPDVACFDEHEERSPDGKLLRRFTRADLEEIAQSCNERDATGTLAPLTFGHTTPQQPDESKQPEPQGYARTYRVRWDARLGKYVIAVDYYIRKERFAEAKTYPRTSVELWPGNKKTGEKPIIDPVSLLRRTPQRDLGQWTYSKGDSRAPAGDPVWRYSRGGKPCLNYSLETAMPEPWEDDAPATEPTDPGATVGEMAGGGGMSPQEHAQYSKHCAKCYSMMAEHPLHAKAMKQYAMEDAPPEEPAAADPTMPPDVAEPIRNGAFATPSATNAGLGDPQRNARRAAPVQQVRRDSDAIRLARVERENAEMKAQLAEERQAKIEEQQITAESDGRRIIAQMQHEGYTFKAPEKHVLRFSKMLTRKAREDYEEHLRELMDPAPVAPIGRIRTDTQQYARTGSDAPVDLENDPESMPAEDAAAVDRYQRKHGLWDTPLPELAAKALPLKYGKQHANGNGANGNGARK